MCISFGEVYIYDRYFQDVWQKLQVMKCTQWTSFVVGLVSLTTLYLSGNSLTILPSDFFAEMTALEFVQLAWNGFNVFPDTSASGPTLTSLTLSKSM